MIYRIETIRIIEEIDNLEFCLNAIDSQDIITKLSLTTNFIPILQVICVRYPNNSLIGNQNLKFLYNGRFTIFGVTIVLIIAWFTYNRYKSHILVFFCIFAFDFISYVLISWYAKEL